MLQTWYIWIIAIVIFRSTGYQLATDGNAFTTHVYYCGLFNGDLSMGSNVSLLNLILIKKKH